MSGWTIPIVMAVMAAIAFGLWYIVPKGDNQACVWHMAPSLYCILA